MPKSDGFLSIEFTCESGAVVCLTNCSTQINKPYKVDVAVRRFKYGKQNPYLVLFNKIKKGLSLICHQKHIKHIKPGSDTIP